VALALYARQQRFVARLANTCQGTKSKELFEYPMSSTIVGRVAVKMYAGGRRAETMCWPDPGEKPAVKTIRLEEKTQGKRASERWAKETEGKSESGTWTWWTDGLRTDDEIL